MARPLHYRLTRRQARGRAATRAAGGHRRQAASLHTRRAAAHPHDVACVLASAGCGCDASQPRRTPCMPHRVLDQREAAASRSHSRACAYCNGCKPGHRRFCSRLRWPHGSHPTCERREKGLSDFYNRRSHKYVRRSRRSRRSGAGRWQATASWRCRWWSGWPGASTCATHTPGPMRCPRVRLREVQRAEASSRWRHPALERCCGALPPRTGGGAAQGIDAAPWRAQPPRQRLRGPQARHCSCDGRSRRHAVGKWRRQRCCHHARCVARAAACAAARGYSPPRPCSRHPPHPRWRRRPLHLLGRR